MWTYQAPVADMLYVMDPVLGAPASWAEMPHFDGLDADTAREVVAQAARFAGEVLAPTNAPGDPAGCTWSPDGVTTPPGYRTAYQAFVGGGWPALACAPEAGGQGLPQLLNAALFEMLAAANHGWTMYPGLLHGAYEVVKAHAVPMLRERYLAKLTSGEWLGTMCLTEPQAGSDLGQVRTRADLVGQGEGATTPAANGAPVLISGGKIFISGGDHDLTDNIVHLVLCRLADAPAGTRGLSLAVAPRILPDGRRNAVHCDSIEKKMGIKGSATCQMRFEGAEGWLIGEPNRGLAAMFLMMNAARLHVGLQGLGHRSADEALHVWGGYGHVHEFGIEQTVRDSRIAMIYEGSNEIQAVDLVQRKLLDDGGARGDALMQDLAREVAACRAVSALQPALHHFAAALAQQLQSWRSVQQALLAGRAADPEWPLRVADDVLHGIGHALMCWAWARTARTALDPTCPTPPGGRSAAQWLQSAQFGLDWLLPQAPVHWGQAGRADAALPFLTV